MRRALPQRSGVRHGFGQTSITRPPHPGGRPIESSPRSRGEDGAIARRRTDVLTNALWRRMRGDADLSRAAGPSPQPCSPQAGRRACSGVGEVAGAAAAHAGRAGPDVGVRHRAHVAALVRRGDQRKLLLEVCALARPARRRLARHHKGLEFLAAGAAAVGENRHRRVRELNSNFCICALQGCPSRPGRGAASSGCREASWRPPNALKSALIQWLHSFSGNRCATRLKCSSVVSIVRS